MILKEIRLHPFAGTTDRTILLDGGLNVILGRNEAGKSTLVRALASVLFQPVTLTPAAFKKTMGGFLPLGSGDTIRVSLDFEAAGGKYHLEKSWGGTKSSRLCLPDGHDITNPEEVEKQLRNLLVLSQGTYENVLVTYQAQLAGTMDSLRSEGEVTNSLHDILRRSFFKADGVSVDKLRDLVCKTEEKYFSRWDARAERPEGGRDIEHPWDRQVGIILKKYYDYRRLERDFRKAEEYERRIDDFAGQGATLEREVAALSTFVQKNRGLVDDARVRSERTTALALVQREVQEFKVVQREWPRCEDQIKTLDTVLTDLRNRVKQLKAESKEVEAFEAGRGLRERLAQAQPMYAALDVEEKKLESLPHPAEADVKEARTALQTVRQLEVKSEAQALALRLRARTPFRGTLRGGSGEERDINLAAGEEFKGEVKGRADLSHPDWELHMQPGGEDADAVERQLMKARSQLKKLLGRWNVGNLDDLLVLQKVFENQKATVDRQRAALAAVTGGKTIEEFQAAVDAVPVPASRRTLSEINEELAEVTAQGKEKKGEQERLEQQCKIWAEKFRTQDVLGDLLYEKRKQQEVHEQELEKLKPLPEGIADARQFVAEFETKAAALEKAQSSLHALQLERKEFEKAAPALSCEELREQYQSALADFQHEKEKGNAYVRIRQELESLLQEMDKNTFQPLAERFSALLQTLTSERYIGVELKESIPVRVRGDDVPLPIGLLSVGTLDILALAIRLGMAEYYLGGSDGFVLMDDPLVNLDPERQKSAATVLRTFAGSKQTIVLTCHPSHAELIGGKVVALD